MRRDALGEAALDDDVATRGAERHGAVSCNVRVMNRYFAGSFLGSLSGIRGARGHYGREAKSALSLGPTRRADRSRRQYICLLTLRGGGATGHIAPIAVALTNPTEA